MKKWERLFAAACAGVICAVGMPLTEVSRYLPEVRIIASAEDSYTYDVFTYTYLYDGTIQITDCNAENLDVKIPREINGAAVTKVKFKSWWHDVTSIAIPDTVINIEINVWADTSILENITVSKDNTVYSSEDGVLFDKNKTTLICYPIRKSETSYQIPNSVTSISNYAFWFCKSLESVVIPNSVTSIGTSALYGTPWMEKRQAEDPLVTVNGILIDGTTCSGDVIIPNSVTSIANTAFRSCTDLERVVIPNSVTSIGDNAFRSCKNLKSVVIGGGVTSIGASAFYECVSLESVTIGGGVTRIWSYAFNGCEALADVYFNGTPSEWNAIEKGSNNEPLLLATIHFSSVLNTGDLDNDGKITMADAYQALIASSKVALGEDDGLTAEQFMAADVDGSGRLTMMDAYWILMYSSYSYIGEEITWDELLG